MAELRIVGRATTYPEMVAFLHDWYLVGMNTNFEVIDKIAGLAERYTGKLLSPRASKNIGMASLEALLGAGGLTMLFAVDDDVLARIRARSDFREHANVATMPTKDMLTDKSRAMTARKRTQHLVGNSAWGRMMRCRRTIKVITQAAQAAG